MSRYDEYLQSPEWQEKRQAALHRAEHACQVCNSPKELQVHHRTYRRLYREQPADLTVLCSECHALFHHKIRKPRASLSKRTPPGPFRSLMDRVEDRKEQKRILKDGYEEVRGRVEKEIESGGGE